MLPGDAPRFQGPAFDPRQMRALGEDVGQLLGLRASPPLQLDQTPAGFLLSLKGAETAVQVLTEEDVDLDPAGLPILGSDGLPRPTNRWGWYEPAALASGAVGLPPDGARSGRPTMYWTVPVAGTGAAGAVGVGTLKGSYWEWVPCQIGFRPVRQTWTQAELKFGFGEAGSTVAITDCTVSFPDPGLYLIDLFVVCGFKTLQPYPDVTGDYAAAMNLTYGLAQNRGSGDPPTTDFSALYETTRTAFQFNAPKSITNADRDGEHVYTVHASGILDSRPGSPHGRAVGDVPMTTYTYALTFAGASNSAAYFVRDRWVTAQRLA